jgi:hypothetical protein
VPDAALRSFVLKKFTIFLACTDEWVDQNFRRDILILSLGLTTKNGAVSSGRICLLFTNKPLLVVAHGQLQISRKTFKVHLSPSFLDPPHRNHLYD